MNFFKKTLLALMTAGATVGASHAQELRIGLSAEPTSADPQFFDSAPNSALAAHLFGSLVSADENRKLLPGLARSWKMLDDTTWEFKLQPKATFTSGEKLTPRDVVYSFCRIPFVQGSPGTFSDLVKTIASIDAPDDETVVIKTDKPDPILPNRLISAFIINADAFGGGKNIKFKKDGCEDFGDNPNPSDFNNPAKSVGAGPYKLAEFTPGSQIVLERNDNYWGEVPHWKRVIMKPLTNAGARVAGLIAGDVDMIEAPSVQDFERLTNSGFSVARALTPRLLYIQLDQNNDPAWKSPTVKGVDNTPMSDRRVRQAMSMAINRQAITDKIMGGLAAPAGELLPYPMFGSTKDFPVTEYDPEGAKKLLAEAGYSDGFQITLATPNDRYINADKVAQAVAQMWTRIGIKTDVDAMTAGTFFGRRNKFEFSAFLAGYGSTTGEMSEKIDALVLTRNPDKETGTLNLSHYSNPAVDELVTQAKQTVEDKNREQLLQQAAKTAMDDVALLPVYFEVRPWALRKGLTYSARSDEQTRAMSVKPDTAN
ncbi:ABC transporter substrate-binding protein [Pararhizobium sp. YC-54]|uniref:ABC transporter substrate-binding protein n=1 Tax=Pararhizobium sp. YC-54 TaxID=2986920 RepID=UPI0021F78030|nr:ABC transporter substrate-binding protein [Pararhizobium sp. YC-54]MCW0002168.1 ABC transporter substrate-binding protein [Pararhizobium sp. YC-54]